MLAVCCLIRWSWLITCCLIIFLLCFRPAGRRANEVEEVLKSARLEKDKNLAASNLEKALDYLLDPCTGSPAKNEKVKGEIVAQKKNLGTGGGVGLKRREGGRRWSCFSVDSPRGRISEETIGPLPKGVYLS